MASSTPPWQYRIIIVIAVVVLFTHILASAIAFSGVSGEEAGAGDGGGGGGPNAAAAAADGIGVKRPAPKKVRVRGSKKRRLIIIDRPIKFWSRELGSKHKKLNSKKKYSITF